jgi:hypothetical protein
VVIDLGDPGGVGHRREAYPGRLLRHQAEGSGVMLPASGARVGTVERPIHFPTGRGQPRPAPS